MSQHYGYSDEHWMGIMTVFSTVLAIETWIRRLHFTRNFARTTNLDQLALVNAGATPGLIIPGSLIFHQLGPERISSALHRLYFVNRASRLIQKMTLRFGRFSQAQDVTKAHHIFFFKRFCADAKMFRDVPEIAFSDVDETFGVATARTAGLAGKPHQVSL